MNMKRYDTYKPSGIAWIGEVPEHWDLKKIKFCFDVYAGATPKTENPDNWDGDIVWVTPADYKTEDKFIKGGQRTITKQGYDSCNTQLVPVGSIIFSKRAPIGTVALNDVELCTNQGCLSCVPKGTNSTYYYYVMSISTEWFDLLGSGATFKEISADNFSNVKLPFPPLAEQEAIAAYLDVRCADIDKVVATQQKRIALLQELKQSEITQAVTRGLNPDARMKDSGVEWIGMVPEHWEVRRIKFSCQVTDGTHFSPPTTKEGMPYITVSNVYDDIIDLENANRISEKDFLDLVKQGCQPQVGDVLLAKDGTVGRTAIVRDNQFVALSSLGILHPMEGLSSNFLKYSLDSQFLQEQMKAAMAGSALRRITISKICEFVSFIPPTDEQNDIVEHLDRRCGEIDKQIGAVTRQIELLREYKQALITEVVTGKRRV